MISPMWSENIALQVCHNTLHFWKRQLRFGNRGIFFVKWKHTYTPLHSVFLRLSFAKTKFWERTLQKATTTDFPSYPPPYDQENNNDNYQEHL